MLIRISDDNDIVWDANSMIYCPISPRPLFQVGEKVLTCDLTDSHWLINDGRVSLLT